MRSSVARLASAHSRLLLRVFFQEIEDVGEIRVQPGTRMLLVANHVNSVVDPLLLLGFLAPHARMLAKSTVFRHPVIAPLLWLDSPGSLLLRQTRVGRGGREFLMWKLRTMVPDAERHTGPQWAADDDPRVTRVGRILRKTRLDEAPQLINVLRGEMSLIGPRPERPEFVSELSQTIPFYRTRHVIKPGITGWAQVRYEYGNSEADALVKLQYDLYYIRHRSLALDVVILLRTVGIVLTLRGT